MSGKPRDFLIAHTAVTQPNNLPDSSAPSRPRRRRRGRAPRRRRLIKLVPVDLLDLDVLHARLFSRPPLLLHAPVVRALPLRRALGALRLRVGALRLRLLVEDRRKRRRVRRNRLPMPQPPEGAREARSERLANRLRRQRCSNHRRRAEGGGERRHAAPPRRAARAARVIPRRRAGRSARAQEERGRHHERSVMACASAAPSRHSHRCAVVPRDVGALDAAARLIHPKSALTRTLVNACGARRGATLVPRLKGATRRAAS